MGEIIIPLYIGALNFVLYSILSYTLKKFKIFHSEGRKEWLFRNHFCSLAHSMVSAMFVTYSILKSPHLLEDPILGHSVLSSYAFAASTGYFLYDTVDIITSDGFRQWILIVHHVFILIAFPYSIATNSYHGFGASALLMEWNSIFLHSRKLLKFQEYNAEDILYKINTMLLLVTMLIYRYLLCFYLVYVIWRDRMLMAWLPFLIGMTSILVFVPANVGLFYQICVKDLFPRREEKVVKKD